MASAARWLTFEVCDARTGYGPYVAYLAWTIPLAAGLAVALLRPAARRPECAPAVRVAAPAPP